MSVTKLPPGAQRVMTTAASNVDVDKANKDKSVSRAADRLMDASDEWRNGGLKDKIRLVNNKVAGRGAMRPDELQNQVEKATNLRRELKGVGPFKIREHVAGFFGFGRKADVRAMKKAADLFNSTLNKKFPKEKGLSEDLKHNVPGMARGKDDRFPKPKK